MFGGDNYFAKLYDHYHERFWLHGDEPVGHSIRLRKGLEKFPLHCDAARRTLECAWFSALGTSKGQRVQSVDLDGSVRPVSIDAEALGERCEVFWDRIPFTLPMYYREIVGSGNCCVEISSFVSEVPGYQGDLEEGREFLDNLLAEATCLKQWTIPFGAYVLLNAGEIEAAKLHEIGNDVSVLLVNRVGDYFLVWVNPAEKYFSFASGLDLALGACATAKLKADGKDPFSPEGEHFSNEFRERFELGFKILLASIIRDFWVVEERERVFGASLEIKKSARLRCDRGKPQIVYLPRIRYVGDCPDRLDDLNLKARAPHFVVGHLRKAAQAAERQIILARQYGIVVPEGFTFVRPHQRGDVAQERIYRSRSALRCLRALTPVPDVTSRDSWFTFELKIHEWLATNGFQVEHLAASRNGDGGVDIQASKGNEHLLVQCKYWRTQKVGPNVIREMLGTLQTFPAGSRGVVVTSSELTGPAKDFAIENGVQFIERINFITGISWRL